MFSLRTEVTLFRVFALIVTGTAYFFLFCIVLRAVFWKLAEAPVTLASKYEIAVRLVSAVHGLCCGAVGLLAVRSLGLDFMNDRCFFLVDAMWIFAGYFIYDVVASFLAYSRKPRLIALPIEEQFRAFWRDRTMIIIHHLSLPLVGLPLFRLFFQGRGDIFFAVFFVQELSTPFVSFRYVLKHCGLTKKRLYVVNGVCLVLAFFVFRVMALPYLYYRYQRFANVPHLWDVPLLLPWYCNLGCSVLFAPQYYWFAQICRKGLQFRARRKADRES